MALWSPTDGLQEGNGQLRVSNRLLLVTVTVTEGRRQTKQFCYAKGETLMGKNLGH